MTSLLEKSILISRGSKKATSYLINPKLLSTTRLNIKPTLKTIELPRLKALIEEDLKLNLDSSITQIFERLGKEVPKEDIQKIVYKMKKEGILDTGGSSKNKTTYRLAKKK